MTNIHFSLYNDLWIQTDTDDRDILRDIDEFLTDYVPGFRFQPRYKSGIWDGKVSLFKKATRSFPYGLFFDVLKHIKKEWLPDVKITISNDIKDMFGYGTTPNFIYDLKYHPYPYQQECVEAMIKATKGVVTVATAGGKSLIIAYIIRNLPKDSKSLIVVPTLQLVDQFHSDLISYGFSESIIGCVNSKKKEFNNSVVISTWQSLKNQEDHFNSFNCVICDETHGSKAAVISDILQNIPNAKYKFGVTGTLPNNKLDAMKVKSFIGPELKCFVGKDLANLGFVSQCKIKQIYLNYKKNYGSDYNTIRDDVFVDPFRMLIIKGIINKSNNSVLVLVEKVEKEGEVIEQYLRDNFPNKEVIFISGRDKSDVREIVRKDMNVEKGMVVVATYGVFSTGINVPALREIILAASSKSFIRVIQSLGRVLRKHVDKELGGAILWDIADNVKHLKDHASARYKHYTKEKYEVEEITIEEK